METLKPLIDQLVKMIQQGADLVSGQLPEVAQQILRFKFWESLLDTVIFLGIALLLSWLCWKLLKRILECESSMDSRWIGVFILGGGSIASAIGSVYCIEQLLQIHLAPKLFLIEYLRGILK